jgi:UDP-N-acetylmuramate dehydrogenase
LSLPVWRIAAFRGNPGAERLERPTRGEVRTGKNMKADFLSDLSEIVTEKVPLASHTYLRVGGPARWFARPRSVDHIRELVRRCRNEGIEFLPLGLGANLVVSDEGVDALVIRLGEPVFQSVDWGAAEAHKGDNPVTLSVAAGADMHRLTSDAVRRGLGGLERMAGIPGTVGGILRMNAGGRFGSICDVVRDVTVVDAAGEWRTLTRDEAGFRYRGSDLGGMVICGAGLMLEPTDPRQLRARFREIWEMKKNTQPLADNSAGCVFKNPPGGSAGGLIDQAGLKGRRVGGAVVSPKHANFIVTEAGATAQDVLTLIGMIRREVADRFGVELETEVQLWGRQRARSSEPIG